MSLPNTVLYSIAVVAALGFVTVAMSMNHATAGLLMIFCLGSAFTALALTTESSPRPSQRERLAALRRARRKAVKNSRSRNPVRL